MMYKSVIRFLSALLSGLALSASSATACLTFCLQHDDEVVFGRNFDWPVDTGALIVNRRHVQKTAFVPPPEQPVTWVSKYGSVTFNQFSKEVPIGGMNEEGLVIESMVSRTEQPAADTRKAINELQWIQYQLDTCKSVGEVIESARGIRIARFAVGLHYFVSDRSGKGAAIEFLNGKMVHRSAERLPAKVLANTSYDEALLTLGGGEGTGAKGAPFRPRGDTRFQRAAGMIAEYDGRQPAVAFAFRTLDAVSQRDFTKWQVVYDITQRRIYFRTLRDHGIRIVELANFDFGRLNDTLMLDVNSGGPGSVGDRFQVYTETLNDALINASLVEFKKAGIMQFIKAEQIAYIKKVVASCRPKPSAQAD